MTMTAQQRRDFDRAVRPHLPALRTKAIRMCYGHEANGEDVLQDALIRAARAWHRFDGENVGGWLSTIVSNTTINHYHRGRVRTEYEGRVGACARSFGLPVIGGSTFEAGGDSYATNSAEDKLDARREREAILVALDSIPPTYARATRLALTGVAYKAIAEGLDIPVGTVMSRVSRGRQYLREVLGPVASERLAVAS